MVKRTTISLPDDVHEKLVRWAANRDQGLATLAAICVEKQVDVAIAQGDIPPPESTQTDSVEKKTK